MQLQTLIQHAGPRRAHLLPDLQRALPEAQVITDPGADENQRSPLRCYRACLAALDDEATHLLIVQDDAQPCRDFTPALRNIIDARPDDPIALFVPGLGRNNRRMLDACYRGNRWFELDPAEWVPTVALLLPRDHAESLAAFIDAKRYPPSRSADDSVVGDWARDLKIPVWATVPSLVEHYDREPSLVKTAHFGGLNPGRVAACWVGEEMSALEFEW